MLIQTDLIDRNITTQNYIYHQQQQQDTNHGKVFFYRTLIDACDDGFMNMHM